MPRYDYQCPNCPQTLEIKHSMADEPLVVCPACGATMRRRICITPIKFGQGWHKPMDWGKHDDIIVSTPSGTNRRTWNEVHGEG